jgi:hypothetical protein
MSGKAASILAPAVSLWAPKARVHTNQRVAVIESQISAFPRFTTAELPPNSPRLPPTTGFSSRKALLESLRAQQDEEEEESAQRPSSAFNIKRGFLATEKSKSSPTSSSGPRSKPNSQSRGEAPAQRRKSDELHDFEQAMASRNISAARDAVRRLLRKQAARIGSDNQTRYFEMLTDAHKFISVRDLLEEIELFESEGSPLGSSALGEIGRAFYRREYFENGAKVIERLRAELWKTRGLDLEYSHAKWLIALYARAGQWEQAAAVATRMKKPSIADEMTVRRLLAEGDIDGAFDHMLQLAANHSTIAISVLQPPIFTVVGEQLLSLKKFDKYDLACYLLACLC